MPDPNVGVTIAASWNALVNDTPEDNIFIDNWFLNRLKNGDGFVSTDGGDIITASLEYAVNGTVTSYSDTETISTTRQDVFDRAQYNWKEYAGTVVQSELENAINQGGAKKFDLLKAKLANLKKSFDRQFDIDLHGDGTANSSKVLGGLQALVLTSPATGTTGGINRATFSFWRNQQASGAKTTSAFDNLRASLRSVYNLSSNGVAGDHPKFVEMDRASFEGLEGLLLANERFTSKAEADGGFKNEVLKFKGAMCAYGPNVAAGYAYLLNPAYVKLQYLKGHWYKAGETVEPANQTVKVFKVHTICNLIGTNLRMVGVVNGIT
jgi:hypothetical protein